MKDKGVEVERKRFSGFWCQGDGASFAGRISKFSLFIEKNFNEADAKKYAPIGEITHAWDGPQFFSEFSTSNYCHSNTMQYTEMLDFDNEDSEHVEPLIALALKQRNNDALVLWKDFVADAEKLFRGFADKLYSDLEDEYEHLTSDEAVLDTLLANEDILKERLQEYADEDAEEAEDTLA